MGTRVGVWVGTAVAAGVGVGVWIGAGGVVARASEEWSEHYAKRQAVERLFGSLKRSRNLEVHFSRNINRMRLHATLSLVAYQATALARAKEDELDNLRQMRVGVSATAGLRMVA